VLVLDAEKQQLLKFSPQGAFLEMIGRAGEGPNELTGVMDLSSVNDRSYLLVVQQRNEPNFNLLDPGTGRSDRTWGTLTGELTPRFGCVTGVTGRLAGPREGGGQPSSKPLFWFADEDKERIFRTQYPAAPEAPLPLELDEVCDMEAMPTGHVLVADGGDGKLLVLNPDGTLALSLAPSERLERCFDLGVDDYGRVYAFDATRRRVVELSDSD
jgi:hypothetical protein